MWNEWWWIEGRKEKEGIQNNVTTNVTILSFMLIIQWLLDNRYLILISILFINDVSKFELD